MSLITYNGESKVIKRICELLDTMTGISFVVVQTLPTVDIQTNVIYLVPKTTTEVDNIYDEYINTDGTSQGWELIGTTEIDLTNYVQFSDLSTVATSGDYDDLIDKPTIPTVTDRVDWASNGKLGTKNLNSYPPYNETTHTDTGVVFTDNGDGTITATGKSTASSRSGFVCHSRAVGSTGAFFLKNGTYTLTGCPSGGSDNSYYIEISRTANGGNTSYGKDYGEGLTFTVNGDDNYADKAQIQLVCYCVKDYQLPNNGIVFKPMIRLAVDTDSTYQPYSMTNVELTDNKASKEEAEKVKQIFTDNTDSNFYLLGSYSDSQGDETNTVKKNAHAYFNGKNGNLTIRRKHYSTSLNNNTIIIGNDIPEGTAGNCNGIVRMYGKGAYYGQFYDQYNYLTANRNYLLRNATGMLGLYSDSADFAVKANLNILDNFIYPPYYHSTGSYGNLSYSTNFETGEYTVKGSDTSNRALNLKRYTSGFYLPAGKYKLSGCPSGGSSSKYSLRIYKSTEGGSTTGIGSDYGNGLEFTLTERTLMQIVFYVNANQSVDFTFRPKLEKLSDWVDLGVQTIGSTITLTEKYSELMVEVNYGDVFYQNIHILRTQLTSIPKYYYATISEDYDFYASVYLDGTDIKLKGNTQVSGTDYKLYAKV